jgi:hypothetical protein
LALLTTACAASTEGPFPDDEGGGGSQAQGGQGGGSGGSTTGGGGEGGDGDLCEQDCEAIMVPDCLMSVCNEGQYMGTIGTCVVVDAPDGGSCEDGEFCTVNDVCIAGTCTAGDPNTCGITPQGCELITCDESSDMCSTTPSMNGDPCTPVNLCDVNGHCQNGLCVGMPKDCFFAPVPNECHISECDPANGMCTPVPNPAAQGVSCTDLSDPCTVNKTCDAMGACQGGQPKSCSFLDIDCNVGVCDPMNGNCVPQPLMDGDPCNDFNSCTDMDTCQAGMCTGAPVNGCQTYFEENFDGGCPPPAWTLTGDWQCGMPTSGPNMAYSGANVIATVLNGNYNNNLTFAGCNAQTPPIDLTTATDPILSLRAWWHTENQPFDGWNVKISTDNGQTFSVLSSVTPPYNGTVSGETVYTNNQSSLGYQHVMADLSAYVGQLVVLRFSFRTDGSVVHPGVYIDDVQVMEAVLVPLVITTAQLPNGFINQPYTASLQRTGGTPNAVWSITGGVNHGWLSINPSTGQLTGTPPMGGQVTVDVHVEEPMAPSNFDDASFTFDVQSALYAETFEGPCPNGWTFGGDWECGVPSVVGPATAYSGAQCIATQIDGNYNNNQSYAVTNATSPPINLAGAVNPTATWRMWLWTEGAGFDGVNLKVSTNGGATYTVVPTVMPAYNATVAAESAWNGNNSGAGWVAYTADLTAYAGQNVLLRFSFRTDGSVVYPGAYVDDFVVSD